MLKIFSKIIFYPLYYFDLVLYKLFRKKYLGFLYESIRQNSYTNIEISGKTVNFFTPNYYTQLRVNTFFSKEPKTLEWIDSFKKGNNIIFWDIGANVGLYSIYSAIKHNNISIVCFEPSFNNLPVLSRNLYINDLSNKVKINQFPLTSTGNEYMNFKESLFSEGAGLNTFGVNFDHEGKKFNNVNNYTIYGTSINYILDNKFLDIPDYIKIDVDGIEHLILEGADKYLSNKKIKSILVEINNNFIEQKTKCDRILKGNGFNLVAKESADFDSKSISTYNYIYSK